MVVLTGAEGAQERGEDLALVGAVARGDRAAFATLYDRYAPRLGRYAMTLLRRADLVDEVIDDVMLFVWQSARRFDPEVARLSTWLFGITHHQALKRLARSPGRGREVPLEGAEDAADDGPVHAAAGLDPEEAAIGRQLGAALADGLARLSADHRAVIELAFGEGCSYQEIAAITGSPVNTVKTRMFHARKHLARFLGRRADRAGSAP
jgi:RNA polymerase sigma-70 factor (ECF subfamily)